MSDAEIILNTANELGKALKQIAQLTKERDELEVKWVDAVACQHKAEQEREDLRAELERVKVDRNKRGVIARREALKISEGFKAERDEEKLNRIGCEYAMTELRRCCGLDMSKTDLSEVKLYVDGLRSRAEAAEAKCAEMRSIIGTDIQRICNDVKQGGVLGEILQEYIDKALSDQCGVGWLSPDKKKVLVEALEKLARLGNEPHYGNSIGNQIAKQALEAVR